MTPPATLALRGRPWPAFQVCGFAGAVLGTTAALALAIHTGLSARLIGALAGVSIATFLALAMATKIVTGRENLVYYYHEIAVLAANGLLLRALGEPVRPYLDLSIVGLGLFLVCGRIGCFLVGCCHGRPSRCWGVSYGPSHVAAGFTPHYAGVRLFPVQILESAAVLAIVVAGAAMVWLGAPAGTALAWYGISYNAVRYGLEFLRGDPERPYLAAVSEAQWIALALSLGLSAAEALGWLPIHPWHLAVTAGMLAVTSTVAYRRPRKLLAPRHVREIAEAVASLDSPLAPGVAAADRKPVDVRRTSLGLCISADRLRQGPGPLDYFAISSRFGLSQQDARLVADLLGRLRHAPGGQVTAGRGGVYHVSIQTGGN